ncbi:hypothetical protein D7X30_31065 [Corallococcus sp. AB011P]|uniref:hypothetical protein n=1 Tax=unclassified Corallococcus TaxID=2685029 RepID=UPI000EA1D585|nr:MULTISPECIES: hypothetical protein [unclassified Corallococcus]RKG53410.1 hypothetical protein D7X30_31065 [Corallococcus sp. AB011P]RKH89029.1 hypothetical protein D7Y21_12295 [Corallococcus sp. AB045]
MRKSILSTLVTVALAGSVTACDIEQPDPGCIVQDASFANWWAKFDAVDAPTGTCTDFEPLLGDELGVWKFADPVANTAKLVIRPLSLAALGQFDLTNTFDSLQATGKLSTGKDADQFCTADTFTTATVNVDQGDFAAAPQAITYQFDNVKVYSNTRAPGTQMTGELTYTNNGCTAHYVVRAVWPATNCDPTLDPNDEANFTSTCGPGSGINPDFDLVCDAETEYCTPAKAIPSFK